MNGGEYANLDKKLTEAQASLSEITIKLAVIVEHQKRMQTDITGNTLAIRDMGESVRCLDKKLAINTALSSDRLTRAETDMAKIQNFVRENGIKIAELLAIVALLTKTAGLW